MGVTTLSRRALMAGAGALALSGCSRGDQPPGSNPGSECRTAESLVSFSKVGGARLGYEIGRKPTTMQADPRFVELLDAWAADWTTMSGLGPITTVWSYGAYVDKCHSLHAAGRAFDFAEVQHARGSVSCRFDTWQPGSAKQLRNYWRLAASLHLHFAYTLSYLYDEAHHNHIHVDNLVSQWGRSTFDPGSKVQVELVQAAARHVFGHDVAANGQWDDATRSTLRTIQRSLGITRPLSDPDGWQAFCRATASA